MPKIIRVDENLTKLWQKQFCLFFETRCSSKSAHCCYLCRGRSKPGRPICRSLTDRLTTFVMDHVLVQTRSTLY